MTALSLLFILAMLGVGLASWLWIVREVTATVRALRDGHAVD